MKIRALSFSSLPCLTSTFCSPIIREQLWNDLYKLSFDSVSSTCWSWGCIHSKRQVSNRDLGFPDLEGPLGFQSHSQRLVLCHMVCMKTWWRENDSANNNQEICLWYHLRRSRIKVPSHVETLISSQKSVNKNMLESRKWKIKLSYPVGA